MKTLLIYGDSNTFGQTNWPVLDKPRVDYELRWTSRVQHHFSETLRVIPEGLGGRTAGDLQTGNDSHRNGQAYFKMVFNSHEPVDILLIALGTNDCQSRYNRTAEQIVADLLWYKKASETMHVHPTMPSPAVLFLTPPVFVPLPDDPYFAGQQTVRDKLVDIMRAHEDMKIIEPGHTAMSPDGIHLSPEGHRQVAIAVEQKVKGLS